MLAWSPEDAAKIIETYKIYENKPPDLIMERTDTNPQQKVLIYVLFLIVLLMTTYYMFMSFVSVD